MPLTYGVRLASRDRSCGFIQKDHYFSEGTVPNLMTKVPEHAGNSCTGAENLHYCRPQIEDIITVSCVSDTRHVRGEGGAPALQPSGDHASR